MPYSSHAARALQHAKREIQRGKEIKSIKDKKQVKNKRREKQVKKRNITGNKKKAQDNTQHTHNPIVTVATLRYKKRRIADMRKEEEKCEFGVQGAE